MKSCHLNVTWALILFVDEPGDLLTLHLERLALEAAKYENAKLIDDAGEHWSWSVLRHLYIK